MKRTKRKRKRKKSLTPVELTDKDAEPNNNVLVEKAIWEFKYIYKLPTFKSLVLSLPSALLLRTDQQLVALIMPKPSLSIFHVYVRRR